MDPYLSGDNLVIKTRKPYTITKQRERWTEGEHEKFLEALKLYGRAWQRIEEHIGTKTAVQIRSHAQKFFTKLEKEAIVKGEGHALDIEIPPPRPKKKPSNPYPRKTCTAPVLQLGLKDGKISDTSSTSLLENVTNFEKESEELCDNANILATKECCEKDSCFEPLNLAVAAPCTSPTSADNSSLVSEAPKISFRKYVPVRNDSDNQAESAASLVTANTKENHAELSDEKQLFHDNALKHSVILDPCLSHEESLHSEVVPNPQESRNWYRTSISDEQASQNYPRHVPVHILGGSFARSAQHIHPDMSFMQDGIHGDQNYCNNPAASATSEHYGNAPRSPISQSFLNCHPSFTTMQNSDDYQRFLQTQSSFSSLILSALTQNAAFYAAASFSSASWPWFNTGVPVEPSINSSGVSQSQPISPTCNMPAVAAATVAAATAWWTANGLLPFCPRYHPGFAYSPTEHMDFRRSGNINTEGRENSLDPALGGQQPDTEFSESQNSTVKSRNSSSSESEASEAEKLFGVLNSTGTAEVMMDTDLLHDSSKSNNKKQLDRSSCGSNTTSSSEIEPEPDAMDKHANEEKHIMTNEDNEEPDAVPTTIPDLFSRRSRSNSNVNDSWKEVSEEGRLAFQALFSRQVLPQSFSPSHDLKNKAKKHCGKHGEDGDELMLKLDGKRTDATSASFEKTEVENSSPSIIGNACEGLGHTKLKACRTGFKPYKRCSMEAKEARISSPNCQEEEKDPKKLRLETETAL